MAGQDKRGFGGEIRVVACKRVLEPLVSCLVFGVEGCRRVDSVIRAVWVRIQSIVGSKVWSSAGVMVRAFNEVAKSRVYGI